MSFLEALTWRNATKFFDKEKKVSEANLVKIMEAVQMAPTSFGLQPFFVQVVTKGEVKAKLKMAGWNQEQFSSCSHVLVFCRTTKISERIDAWIKVAKGPNPEPSPALQAFESMTRGWLKNQSSDFLDHWAARQVYLALAFALAACAELRIDSCPMEGFDPKKFDEILSLEKDEMSTAALCIGYRDASVPPYPKVRLPLNVLFRS